MFKFVHLYINHFKIVFKIILILLTVRYCTRDVTMYMKTKLLINKSVSFLLLVMR